MLKFCVPFHVDIQCIMPFMSCVQGRPSIAISMKRRLMITNVPVVDTLSAGDLDTLRDALVNVQLRVMRQEEWTVLELVEKLNNTLDSWWTEIVSVPE